MTKRGGLEGAPYWYGIPLDELEFEWSSDEKLELERYCQKILKNVAGEEMTPRQRLEATMEGKARDRLLIEAYYFNVFAVRTLDSGAGALKPVDVCRYPKLLVKSHLATFGHAGKLSESFASMAWTRLCRYGPLLQPIVLSRDHRKHIRRDENSEKCMG